MHKNIIKLNQIIFIIRLWDVRTLKQVNTIVLDRPLTGLELSQDQSILSIACGNQALFYDSIR